MKISNIIQNSQRCPHCGGPIVAVAELDEGKKDACYYKIKATAKVWPSAYASGRLVQCRKKGAANYGNKSEGVATESTLSDLPRPVKRNQFRSLHKIRKQRGLDEQGVAEVDSRTKKLSGATPAPAENPVHKDIFMRNIDEVRHFVQTGYIDPTKPLANELYDYYDFEIPDAVRRNPQRLIRRIGDMAAPQMKFYANQQMMNEQGVTDSDTQDKTHSNFFRKFSNLIAEAEQQVTEGTRRDFLKASAVAAILSSTPVAKSISNAVSKMSIVKHRGNLGKYQSSNINLHGYNIGKKQFVITVDGKPYTVQTGIGAGFMGQDFKNSDFKSDPYLQKIAPWLDTKDEYILQIADYDIELYDQNNQKIFPVKDQQQMQEMENNGLIDAVIGFLDVYQTDAIAQMAKVPNKPNYPVDLGDQSTDSKNVSASPTTGMSALARAVGAQIGLTATELGKATTNTVLNQPARDMGRIEPMMSPLALPAPTTSLGMQIPKQKSRVAAKQDKEDVAESGNDYFKRRKDEEDRIAGTKPPAQRTPQQTDYARRRAQEKKTEQGVAEGIDELARVLELSGLNLTADEQFDMIELMVETLALEHGVDAETIWEDFESVDDDELFETAAWRRKEGKSARGGLNAKGVASYRRENPGSKLQTAVTTKPSKLKPGSKAAKRRKSFCARMGGVKGPMKKPNGKPTRKALALRKWNC